MVSAVSAALTLAVFSATLANALRPRDYQGELEAGASLIENNASSSGVNVYDGGEACTKEVGDYKAKSSNRFDSKYACTNAFWTPGEYEPNLDEPEKDFTRFNYPSVYESEVWEKFLTQVKLLKKYQKRSSSTTWTNLISIIEALIAQTKELEIFVGYLGTKPVNRPKTGTGIRLVPRGDIGLNGWDRRYYASEVDDVVSPHEHTIQASVQDREIILKLHDTFIWRFEDETLGAPYRIDGPREPRRAGESELEDGPATHAGEIIFLLDKLAGAMIKAIDVSMKSKYAEAFHDYWFASGSEVMVKEKVKIIKEEDKYTAYRSSGSNIGPIDDELMALAKPRIIASREYVAAKSTWGDENGGEPLPLNPKDYWINVFKFVFQAGQMPELKLWEIFLQLGLPRTFTGEDMKTYDRTSENEKWHETIFNAGSAINQHFRTLNYKGGLKSNGADTATTPKMGQLRALVQETYPEVTDNLLGLV